jgi:hypothetical protein
VWHRVTPRLLIVYRRTGNQARQERDDKRDQGRHSNADNDPYGAKCWGDDISEEQQRKNYLVLASPERSHRLASNVRCVQLDRLVFHHRFGSGEAGAGNIGAVGHCALRETRRQCLPLALGSPPCQAMPPVASRSDPATLARSRSNRKCPRCQRCAMRCSLALFAPLVVWG